MDSDAVALPENHFGLWRFLTSLLGQKKRLWRCQKWNRALMCLRPMVEKGEVVVRRRQW